MGNSSTKVEKEDTVVQETSVSRTRKIPNEYHGTSLIMVLNEVLRYIKLEAQAIKLQNENLKTMIIETIVKEGLVKSDPLFEKLYQNIFWTGSYYEGLKISAPNEFDLIMVLKMPAFKGIQLEATTKNARPGYVLVKNLGQILNHLETTNHPHWNIYKKMTSWCDKDGALLQSKVRKWIEGLIDAFLDPKKKEELQSNFQLKEIKMSKQGPAFTIKIQKLSGTDMDVDLVPALEFNEPIVPPQPFKPLTKPTLPWYAIPKSVTGSNEPDKWDNCWKVCCSKHEKRMIKSKNTLKPAIKLIKRLRDEKNWKSLKSYFIKTVAYWGIRDKKLQPDQTLDKVFLQLLELLQNRLEENTIYNFWDPRHNMLDNMRQDTRMNMAGELAGIIKQIKNKHPKEVGKIIAPDRVVYY